MNILILSAGTRNKVVQYFKKAIGNDGIVVATDMSDIAPAVYEADKFYQVPRMTEDGYIDVIFDICKKEKIDGVLTLIDPELSLLAKHSEDFERLGVKVIGSSYELCEMSLDKMAMYNWLCAHGYKAAKSYDAAIAQVQVNLFGWETDVTIANTEGLFTSDKRVYTRMGLSAVASNGTENQTGSATPGAMMGFELFNTRVDVEEAAKDAAKTAVTMLSAEPCPAGVMPVIIDNGFGGVIFHEACGHSLEASQVALGNSEFCGKLGQQIASPIVTAIDDGTMPNEWGSTNIDDEGTPTTRLVLIENGILKNYMVDRLNGRRMGLPSTGNARRQDYTFAPISRMRNTFIAPGEHDDREIISTAGNALYAKKMGGGSVNPATGEFNFSVMEGYLVKDGKIDRPVRGATLIGKGGEVLMKIDRVGKNMTMAQGMCGSMSGSVPTNVGQPMIRVTSLTVGGR